MTAKSFLGRLTAWLRPARRPGRRFTTRPALEGLEDRLALSVSAQFDYRMADHFGLDANGDGRIDLRNDPAYVNPGTFGVTFTPQDTSPATVWHTTYLWKVEGDHLPGPRYLWGATPSTPLAEGTYYVMLRAQDLLTGAVSTNTQAVTVKDLLIVSVGDSYASGEGNPEKPQTFHWWGSVDDDAQWADESQTAPGYPRDAADAHRSTKAAPAQAALALERADPHTSVTFLSVAHTGATVWDTLGQLDRVAQLTRGRQIDALTASVGGNDIGFGDIVAAMTKPGFDTAEWGQKVSDALYWLGGDYYSRYAQLNAKIQGLAPHHVYVTEYPDPTRDADGRSYDRILTDAFPGMGIDAWEEDWARQHVINPLNQTIQRAADKYHWNYVGGIADAFVGHGYGAPAGERWIRTADEAVTLQGPYHNPILYGAFTFGIGGVVADVVSHVETTGTMHPNELGHQAIARALLKSMAAAGWDRTAFTAHTDLAPFGAGFDVRVDRQDLTAGPGENLLVRRSPYNANFLEVVDRGQIVYTGLATALDSLTLTIDASRDTVSRETTPGAAKSLAGGVGDPFHLQTVSVSALFPASANWSLFDSKRDQLARGGFSLGAAQTGENVTPDGHGAYVHYQNGSVYWTAQTGAHEVHGAIRAEWASLGWERSALGYPVSDETAAADGVGRYSLFQGGAIYWTPQTGAHIVSGPVRDYWASQGGERGPLGYPLSDPTPLVGGGWSQFFRGGVVTWTPAGGARVIQPIFGRPPAPVYGYPPGWTPQAASPAPTGPVYGYPPAAPAVVYGYPPAPKAAATPATAVATPPKTSTLDALFANDLTWL